MLDKYVMEDDGFFSWTILGKYEFGDESDPDVTVFVVNMTSQKWMDGQSQPLLYAPCKHKTFN